MSKVHFHHIERIPVIKDRKRLKLFIAQLFEYEAERLNQLDYIFCSDNFLLDINKRFLNHDYYTDIITFDLSEKSGPIVGEIYISLDRIRENAILYKTALQQELLRVIFHGALHLCGYKDKSKKDSSLMRAKENFYLNLFLGSDLRST